MVAKITANYRSLQVFTIKSDHGLSKVDYDKIVEYARSILSKGNLLKKNGICC